MSTPTPGCSATQELPPAHEPDGPSLTARENLVDILERELLGPINGPEEI